MMQAKAQINKKLPPKVKPLFSSKKRFIILRGGRGSAKSWSIAIYLILRATQQVTRILCTREIQNSIKDSVYKLLVDTIKSLQLTPYFYITKDSIKCKHNESEFIFKGLWNNEESIKSTEGINICWVEEAQSISALSLEYLTPTIREPGSQIIFSYNPTFTDDIIHDQYAEKVQFRNDHIELIELNYCDNPYFPEELKIEMEWDKKTNYDLYLHKWMGQCKSASDAQIFKNKWEILEFVIPDMVSEWFYGADWGFAAAPTVLNRSYVKSQSLYIPDEACGIEVSLDDHPALFEEVPDSKRNKITADSARPETIEFMNSRGFFVVPAVKGKGSIEDGIERLKSFERIYVHPRCVNMISNLRNYCYKTDKRSGKVSNIPEDANNDSIDALRYGTEEYVKADTLSDFADAFKSY